MSFDRSNKTDLTALNTEVKNDPVIMGYAAVVHETSKLLDLLNNPSNNVTGAIVNTPIDEVTIPEVSEIIDQTEYAALPEYDKSWVDALISQAENVCLKAYKGKFMAIFGAQSVTRNAAIALLERPASRAEELFGVNTVITKQDWVEARENG